jgi:hypothetical protein
MWTKISAGICVVLLSVPGVLAEGIPAGVGGDPPTEFEGTLNGVHVGSETNPIPIDLVPGGPMWPKFFTVDVGTGGVGPGLVIPVWEHFQILPPPVGVPVLPLTDWHEEVHTPNWTWRGGTLMVGDDDPIDGLLGGPQGAATNIWFDLPIGVKPEPGIPIDVWIHKELIYNGPLIPGTPIVIEVWEYPTVPEPATLALAALGTVTMVLAGSRRRRG